jgi:hypothetical protein
MERGRGWLKPGQPLLFFAAKAEDGMGYLAPTDYVNYGLAPDTTDDWITVASALIDTYCRRISLNVTQYTERFRLRNGTQCLQLTYAPLAALAPATSPLLSVQGRYTRARGGAAMELEELWTAFSLPGAWVTVDPSTVDWTENGSLTLPWTMMGLPFDEVQVTYTAGLATIPDPVMSACALIVKNAQSTTGMNVKSSRVDMVQVQYFSDQLVDNTVKTLLRPWVANRLG